MEKHFYGKTFSWKKHFHEEASSWKNIFMLKRESISYKGANINIVNIGSWNSQRGTFGSWNNQKGGPSDHGTVRGQPFGSLVRSLVSVEYLFHKE